MSGSGAGHSPPAPVRTGLARVTAPLAGVAFVGLAALTAHFVARVTGMSDILSGLIIGLALSTVARSPRFAPGLDLLGTTGLRIGIVLVGLRITLGDITALGVLPFVMLVAIMLAVIAVTVASAPLFKQDRYAALLAGGATAICGASAALALYGLIGRDRVDQARFTLTLVGITVASAIAMTAYPLIAVQLGLTDAQAGFLTGSSIHDVAQALGGGFAVSPGAGKTATVVKLTRVALLPVMLMLVAVWLRRQDVGTGAGATSLRLPWFIIGFMVAVALASMGGIPATMTAWGNSVSHQLLLLAIIATATKARLDQVIGHGWRSFAPVAVATLTSLLLSMFAMQFIT